jgi:hypothetical protein
VPLAVPLAGPLALPLAIVLGTAIAESLCTENELPQAARDWQPVELSLLSALRGEPFQLRTNFSRTRGRP